MNDQSARNLWDTYERAWADIGAEERQRLLASCLTESCTFANHLAEGRGRQELADVIEMFQRNTPGGRIETHDFLTHHHDLMASWSMIDKDGRTILSGHNAGRFDDEGLLTHIAGFWKT